MSVNTPKFRVSYPNVFKPRKNELNGQDEYSVMALFPKGADLSTLKKAAEKAAIAKWGADQNEWPTNLRLPFRDQAEKAKKSASGEMMLPPGHEAGGIFMNLKTKQKPHVVDQNVQDILDQSEFYAGCWAIASVNAYAYDQKGNKGVSFGLNNIQKVADGDPLGGRTRPEDDFKAVEGVESGDTGSANSLFS